MNEDWLAQARMVKAMQMEDFAVAAGVKAADLDDPAVRRNLLDLLSVKRGKRMRCSPETWAALHRLLTDREGAGIPTSAVWTPPLITQPEGLRQRQHAMAAVRPDVSLPPDDESEPCASCGEVEVRDMLGRCHVTGDWVCGDCQPAWCAGHGENCE